MLKGAFIDEYVGYSFNDFYRYLASDYFVRYAAREAEG